MTTRRVAAVILAAGASERMGSAKPLVQWRGRSFVRHVVDRAVACGCAPIVVVTGAHAIDAAEVAPAVIVENPRWAAGPTTSLQVGLACVGDVDAVVIATVDWPHVDATTWAALLTAHDTEHVWQPRHGERRGHPLVVPASLLPRIAALTPDETLRDLLRSPEVAPLRRTIEVTDACVLDNIDTPADVARLPV
jgi:CTP:molybdopterin cytidylyltransferase MocA